MSQRARVPGLSGLLKLALDAPAVTAAAATRVAAAGTGLLRGAEQVPALLVRVHETLASVEKMSARADSAVSEAQALLHRVESTRAEAAAVVDDVAELAQRVTGLIGELQPALDAVGEVDPRLVLGLAGTLEQLQPLLSALTGLNADVPDQAASLLRRSAPLLDQVDRVLLPLLQEIRAAVPDVREILPTVQRSEPVMVDVETRIAGLPGAGLMRKRGAREIEDDTADNDRTAS